MTQDASGQPMGDVEREVLAREARRYQAQIDQDGAALNDILSDDMVYTHSSGQTDTKAAFIELVHKIQYRQIDTSEVRVRVEGTVAWVAGVARIRVERDGQLRLNTLRFVNVWCHQGGIWRNTLWQSTAMATPRVL